jgi:predicted small lipoprotein YifL
MVPAIREPALTTWLFRMAVAGTIAVSFTLTACGRKGPLDPPPRAQAQAQAQPVPQPGAPPVQAEVADEYGNPPEPKGQRKGFLLDWLLN